MLRRKGRVQPVTRPGCSQRAMQTRSTEACINMLTQRKQHIDTAAGLGRNTQSHARESVTSYVGSIALQPVREVLETA
jgi:hypothetical protein